MSSLLRWLTSWFSAERYSKSKPPKYKSHSHSPPKYKSRTKSHSHSPPKYKSRTKSMSPPPKYKSRTKSMSHSQSPPKYRSRTKSMSPPPPEYKSRTKSHSVLPPVYVSRTSSKSLKTGTQCIEMFESFVNIPPKTVRFLDPELTQRKCIYDVSKVMIRMCSIDDPLDWDHAFVFRNNAWHFAGGRSGRALRSSRSLRSKRFSSQEILQMLCQSLVNFRGKARMEIDINIQERDKKCDYVNWELSTDLFIKRNTTLNHEQNIIVFDSHTTFPSEVFECSTVELKYIYDFNKNHQVSIWNESEIRFQERGHRYARRH